MGVLESLILLYESIGAEKNQVIVFPVHKFCDIKKGLDELMVGGISYNLTGGVYCDSRSSGDYFVVSTCGYEIEFRTKNIVK